MFGYKIMQASPLRLNPIKTMLCADREIMKLAHVRAQLPGNTAGNWAIKPIRLSPATATAHA